MSFVTDNNRKTFLAVIGWILLAWGVFGTYYAVTQTLLQFAFSTEVFTFRLELANLIVYEALTLIFPVVAIWLGLGLLKRQRSAYRAVFLVGWLYILLWNAATVVAVAQMFHATSQAMSASPEVVESVIDARTEHLAYSARAGIRLLAESVLILWVLSNLKSAAIREEFSGE